MATQAQQDRTIAGRYRIEERLGSGGMGIVWRAHDETLRRPVAIKEVRLPETLDPNEQDDARERVMREARSAAQINHPGAVGVYDVLSEEGHAFIVMELVDAPTLAELVKREGPLTPQRTAALGAEIVDALQRAHDHGVIHRDVKPENVMVPSAGPAKLTDFGVASIMDDPRLTKSGTILGSPAYMAPEQAEGKRGDTRTDVWGLGVTLLYALTGESPFHRGGAIATLQAVLNEPVDVDAEVGGLGRLIERMLAKDPQDRPSPDAAARDLRALASGAGIASATAAPTAVATKQAESAPVSPRTRQAPRTQPADERPVPARSAPNDRTGTWLLVLVGLIALVAAGFFLLTPGDNDTRDRAAPGDAVNQQTDAGEEETDPNADGNAEDEQDAPDEDAADAGATVPEGWTTFAHDATGYEVAHPEDWAVEPGRGTEQSIDLVSPDVPGKYLRIDYRQPAAEDAVAAWEQQEGAFEGDHEDYERVRIEPTEYQGMEAAIWEYTYRAGDLELHAYNLGFRTDDGSYGFALNFQTTESDWEDAQSEWETFLETFQLPPDA